MEINEVNNLDVKSTICNDILRSSPEWFAVKKSIVDYVKKVRDMTFYAAFENTCPVRFVAMKLHNEFTTEI